MPDKLCRLCLKRIEKSHNESKSLNEVKEIIEEVFRIQIEFDSKNERKTYSICPSCSKKLNFSLELFKTINETQKLLKEQSIKDESLEAADETGENDDPKVEIKVEIKIEDEISEKVIAFPIEPKKTPTSKCPKCPKKMEKIGKKSVDKDKIDEEDRKLAEFFHLSCSDCSEEFQKFYIYKNHMLSKHKILYPAVVCCNHRLDKRCRLVEHMIFHTNPEQFKCSECGKQFVNKKSLERHQKLQHLPKENLKFQCDICSKRFLTLNNLRKHIYTHLSKEEKSAMKIHVCNECDSGFKYKSTLEQHKQKVHLKLYACICDICARTFVNKSDFLYHYASMHQTNPLPKVQCEICNKFLLNEKCLKRHYDRNHKNNGPHICHICGKNSPTHQALRSHQLYVHERERKFKCPHCEKAFKIEVALKEHLTTHVGGALYTCDFCEKTFNSGANMYSHRKRAHPEEHERLIKEKLNEKTPENVSLEK